MEKDVQSLFDGWLDGTLAEDEVIRLIDLLGQKEDPWPAQIDAWLQDAALTGLGNAEQKERLFKAITEKCRAQEAPVRRLFLPRVRWAAAVLLLALASAWVYYTLTRPEKPGVPAQAHVQQDIAPGGNKAVLTLGNGAQITLDSVSNGTLAQQGGTRVVKTTNGKLAYQNDRAAHEKIVYNTLTTPRSGQYQLTLADGTRVWLNAESSITYPTTFTGGDRLVWITGEVYMEVAPHAAQTFHVGVGDMQVAVLGTHFNINAYSNEPSIKTTLLEGRVKVSRGGQQQLLDPGQQARLDKNNALTVVSDIDMEEVMAWKNGYFSFRHADVPTVMHQLQRWYDVTIEYKGSIPDIRFAGDIPRNLNASQVLKILEKANVHFTIDGNKIIVTP
ncbi:MAG: FecR domain-containing protein [Chitinophagaceae bacterium]|nr:FecR domain-containing protein [Chitinophagaceae bacterium]